VLGSNDAVAVSTPWHTARSLASPVLDYQNARSRTTWVTCILTTEWRTCADNRTPNRTCPVSCLGQCGWHGNSDCVLPPDRRVSRVCPCQYPSVISVTNNLRQRVLLTHSFGYFYIESTRR